MTVILAHVLRLMQQGPTASDEAEHASSIEQVVEHMSDNVEATNRFAILAQRFCSLVESAPSLDRADLVSRLYRLLPELIGEAINLPIIEFRDDANSEEETGRSLASEARLDGWRKLYTLLKEKLGDWDSYWQVFDPIKDKEAIPGSLADDIADLYRDLKEGLVLAETRQTSMENIIWDWRLLFDSHWGKHAIDALRTIHFLLGSY